VGTVTIPLMKRVGYHDYQAAAIEAAASTGGQVMPPVMAAAAFLMAGITGISYGRIALAAALPAILYYFSLGLYVQFHAMKSNLSPLASRENRRELLLSAPNFLVPLALIIVLLGEGFTPMYVGFWSVIICLVLGNIRKETRPTAKEWVDGLVSGARMAAIIAVSCATVGIMVKIFTMTGLGMKLPAIVEAWSGGILYVALFLVMIVSLILGCGVPTGPAYIMTAIVCAPVLMKMGISLLQAHFFCFYFAVISMVTPPVAPAAMVAAGVAGSNFWKTGIEATKACAAGFLVPFMCIGCPLLLLEPKGGLIFELAQFVCLFVAVIALQGGIVGQYIHRTGTVERPLLLLSAALLFVGVSPPGRMFYSCIIVGVVLFIIVTVMQKRRSGSVPAPVKEAVSVSPEEVVPAPKTGLGGTGFGTE
jgi:TRAP transporter 4TM/12TM fusion protein